MSAPSGVKVPTSLSNAFSSAVADAESVRALVFIIEGESFKHLTTVDTKSSFKDDIALLPSMLPTPKTPASFAYRMDSKEFGKWEWMMITFVPDDAPVRAKMLQASSRSGLLKALGANNFKHVWFATSLNDLTPAALTSHLKHIDSPPPLTASEAALAEVRAAEAEEAKRSVNDAEVARNRQKAVVGLGGKMVWGKGVEEALKKVAGRSDDGWIVCLEIPTSSPGSIALLTSESCSPSAVASKLPPKSPCYTFYSCPTPQSSTPAVKAPTAAPGNTFTGSEGGTRAVVGSWAPKAEAADGAEPDINSLSLAEGDGKGRVLFIYTCPSGSPVKFRMVYSSSVRSVQQDASAKAGVEIAAKLETSDISDLTESHLKSSLPVAKPTHSSSLPTPSGMRFGQPRPTIQSSLPARSATSIPLPASGPATPVSGVSGEAEDDSKDSIRRAFDAFGPRVGGNGGASSAGFSRPRPAGRR
ncbi:twinfilin, partial [Tremellales sp. Uapishka_1]